MLKPPPFLDELSVRLSELLAHTPAADVEKNIRALLTASFERLDLVTREDFEVQRKVLERTLSFQEKKLLRDMVRNVVLEKAAEE